MITRITIYILTLGSDIVIVEGATATLTYLYSDFEIHEDNFSIALFNVSTPVALSTSVDPK